MYICCKCVLTKCLLLIAQGKLINCSKNEKLIQLLFKLQWPDPFIFILIKSSVTCSTCCSKLTRDPTYWGYHSRSSIKNKVRADSLCALTCIIINVCIVSGFHLLHSCRCVLYISSSRLYIDGFTKSDMYGLTSIHVHHCLIEKNPSTLF